MITKSVRQQSLLNAYWIPINFQTTAIMTIAVPAVLLHLSAANHTQVLAVLVSVASILAMVVPPVAGAISDHLRRRGGLRRPVILIGAAVNVLGLFWMARAITLDLFAVALMVAVLGQSVSVAAYQPLIPEVVHPDEWGRASGYQGIAALVGSVLGLGLASFMTPEAIFVLTALLVLVGALLAALTPEGPLSHDQERAHVGNWRDFIIVFSSRFFSNFGLILLMTFVLYFFNDVLKAANPSAGTGFFGVLALLGAVVTSFWMGTLSDKVSRKLIVALAGIPQALAVLGFAIAPNVHLIGALALLFGLGYGAIVSTGWALAIDSVPQLRDAARDLGIWGIGANLPGILAPIFGGWLLAQYHSPLLGYKVMFYVAAACFMLGSVIVLGIRRSKRA